MERGNILLKLGKIDEAVEDYENLVCSNIIIILIFVVMFWSPHRQQMVIRMGRNS